MKIKYNISNVSRDALEALVKLGFYSNSKCLVGNTITLDFFDEDMPIEVTSISRDIRENFCNEGIEWELPTRFKGKVIEVIFVDERGVIDFIYKGRTYTSDGRMIYNRDFSIPMKSVEKEVKEDLAIYYSRRL